MGLKFSGRGDTSISHFDPRERPNEVVPKGYRRDEEGFLHRLPRPTPPMGRKKGTSLAAVPYSPPKARIFVSRVRPTITVEQIREFVGSIAGVEAEVERITTRNDRYASFLIQVEKRVEEQVLDPDEWEEGLIIRPFRGFLRRPPDEDASTRPHSDMQGPTPITTPAHTHDDTREDVEVVNEDSI